MAPHRKPLPPFLHDSYKQYKEDTFVLINWLVNQAKKLGYPHLISKVDSCGSLLQLAQYVSNRARMLPGHIAVVGKRAIDLRKSVTQFFLKHGVAERSINKKHAYFVQVLEEIIQMFDIADKPETEPDGRSDAQSWINRFDALTVEDPEDFAGTEATVPHSDVVRICSIADVAADEQDEVFSQALFQVLCLFHDLRQWQSFIIQTWTDYSESKIDLMSAAVTTDQALKLAHELIHETMTKLPSFVQKDDLDLQLLMYTYAVATTGHQLPAEELGLPYHIGMSDVADSLFLSAGVLLQGFRPVMKPGTLPVYKPGYFGIHDPKADRDKMSAAEKFQEDKIILLEVFPEFFLLGLPTLTLPVLDEISLGMAEFMRDQKLSLWLSFAVQLMLDAYHATRYMRLGPFAELRMTGMRIGRTIDNYNKLSQTHPPPPFWAKEGDIAIKSIREEVCKFIEKDALLEVKLALRDETARKNKPVDHLLFIRNPVLCGLFAFKLNLSMQSIGQALVTQWFDVQQLAFLRNLVNMVPSQSDLVWPDMDLFIKIHGKDHIFMGSLPSDAEQSLRRLEIVTGISSASKFASDSRNGGKYKTDEKGGRRLTPTTMTANLLRNYYDPESGTANPRHSIDGSELNTFLNELFGESAPRGRQSGKGKPKNVELVKGNPYVLLEQKWHNKHNLGFIQLLALMKSKLYDEEPHLMFNYFGMHKRSIEILRLIRDKEHHKFVQYFTEGYMPHETFISNLVILIHHVARGSTKVAKQTGLAKQGDQIASRIVVSCAQIMEAYLEKNGDVAIKELRMFCKNKATLAIENTKKAETDSDQKNSEFYWFCLGEVLGPSAMAALTTGIPIA